MLKLDIQTPPEKIWLDPQNLPKKHQTSGDIWKTTRMPQEVSKRLVNGLYPQYSPFIFVGEILTIDPFTIDPFTSFPGHPSHATFCWAIGWSKLRNLRLFPAFGAPSALVGCASTWVFHTTWATKLSIQGVVLGGSGVGWLVWILGGGISKIFGIFIPKIGEMIQFDEHIFQMGGKTTSFFRLF